MGMSRRLTVVSGRKLIELLHRDGFAHVRQRGSHVRLVKNGPDRMIRVTIPGKHKELKKGTVMGILQQAGLSKDRYLDLLSA